MTPDWRELLSLRFDRIGSLSVQGSTMKLQCMDLFAGILSLCSRCVKLGRTTSGLMQNAIFNWKQSGE